MCCYGVSGKPHSYQSVYKVFEGKALQSASQPPGYWLRFVDDTWVIQQKPHKQALLAIKFTVEGIQENGAIPFLDTLVTPWADNSPSITVYCTPTHTDQYLQWDSDHNLSAKYSVIGTLTYAAKQFAQDQGYSRWNYNILGKCWLNTNTHTGPSIGYKANILTATRRITLIPTIYKTIPPPTLAGIKPIQAGIAITHYKTPTIQMQAQKTSPQQCKNPT